MIQAEIVADSVTPAGARLTTYRLVYPRFIHAEMLTHRALSRNASSSRAVPVRRMIAGIRQALACPTHLGRARAGMQATEEVAGWRRPAALWVWRASGWAATLAAWTLARLGVHKQVANRVIEPYSHVTVILSGTSFAHFFALRCHPAAQPEIQALACLMREAREASTPQRVQWGQWHLPMVGIEERDELMDWEQLATSVARCARVSYLNHDGTDSTLAQDVRLCRRLLKESPAHASPAEHQALADASLGPDGRSNNFIGWRQHREIFEKTPSWLKMAFGQAVDV